MYEINIINDFFNEIIKFDKIYIECSGGYHSCNTVLSFYENNFKNITLIHNDTKLQYKECLNNIQKLIKITDYSIIFKEPNLKKNKISTILKDSFNNINLAKKDIHNYRDYFKCCDILKQERNYKWNKDFLLNNCIIISSITPFESFNRQMFLYKLKKENTFIHYNKSQKLIKGYPYRDLLKGHRTYSREYYNQLFENKLIKYNLNLKHSGCKICPIRILFPNMLTEKDCSIKYFKIFCPDKFLLEQNITDKN